MYTHEGIFRGWHEGRTPEGSPEEIGPDPSARESYEPVPLVLYMIWRLPKAKAGKRI